MDKAKELQIAFEEMTRELVEIRKSVSRIAKVGTARCVEEDIEERGKLEASVSYHVMQDVYDYLHLLGYPVSPDDVSDVVWIARGVATAPGRRTE